MSRGNGRMPSFLDDRDYRQFVHCLGEIVLELGSVYAALGTRVTVHALRSHTATLALTCQPADFARRASHFDNSRANAHLSRASRTFLGLF